MPKSDWREADDYSYVKQLNGPDLAWEFLRRNADYRADYQRVQSGAEPKKYYRPELKSLETEKQWLARCVRADIEPRIVWADEHYANKWHLARTMPDPSKTGPELSSENRTVEFQAESAPRIISRWDEIMDLETSGSQEPHDDGYKETMLSPRNIVVTFSLGEPITPQWERIKKELIKRQKAHAQSVGKGGPNTPKATESDKILRVFDSQVDKALPSIERAEIIYGQNQSKFQPSTKIYDVLKTATRLVKTDYIYLANRQ